MKNENEPNPPSFRSIDRFAMSRGDWRALQAAYRERVAPLLVNAMPERIIVTVGDDPTMTHVWPACVRQARDVLDADSEDAFMAAVERMAGIASRTEPT